MVLQKYDGEVEKCPLERTNEKQHFEKRFKPNPIVDRTLALEKRFIWRYVYVWPVKFDLNWDWEEAESRQESDGRYRWNFCTG